MLNDTQHMLFHGVQLIEVRCRGCGVVTMKRGEPTAAYAELAMAMQMPNGLLAKHETGMCKACRDRIVHDGPQPGELEAIYASDIKHMMKCAMKAGYRRDVVVQMAEKFANWQPIRALQEPGRGER